MYRNQRIAAGILVCLVFFLTPAGAWAQQKDDDKGGTAHEFFMDEGIQAEEESPEGQGPRMSLEEKQRIRERYERFKNLPVEQQEFLKKRWKMFKRLSPEEQDRIRRRHERFMKMTPEEREQVMEKRRKWKEMSPEEREAWKNKKRMNRRMGEPGRRPDIRKDTGQNRSGYQREQREQEDSRPPEKEDAGQ
jgi:hypothetical protein